MGTDKRERQKTARQLKIEAEQRAAVRTRRKRTGIRLAITAVVVVAGLFLYSVLWADDDDDTDTAAADETSTTLADGSSTTSTPAYSNPELAEEVLAREAPDPESPPADTAADALESTTVIDGQGDVVVEAGDTVVVHYIGKVPDGTVFDASWEGGEPVSFPIGVGQVIPGWDQGLLGAKIGERRRLVIGSDNAYGAQGNGEVIPPDTPLAFEIDVVDIIPAAG